MSLAFDEAPGPVEKGRALALVRAATALCRTKTPHLVFGDPPVVSSMAVTTLRSVVDQARRRSVRLRVRTRGPSTLFALGVVGAGASAASGQDRPRRRRDPPMTVLPWVCTRHRAPAVMP
jgi:hypothetical protein